MNSKKKNIILSVVIILVGLALAGGTFAYLTTTISFTNNVVNSSSSCLDIDYVDNTDQITGTLFPSSGPEKGLHGSISLKINDSCSINEATGSIALNINNASKKLISNEFVCKDIETGMIINAIGFNCSRLGGSLQLSSPLKVTVYDNNSYFGEPLSLIDGIFACDSDNEYVEGCQIDLLNDVVVNKTAKTFYISIWLDGSITDNSYTNLTFDGYISASMNQNKSYVYTVNMYNEDDEKNSFVYFGEPIPGGIKQYDNPTSAMAAFDNNPFYYKHHIVNNIVDESYLEFMITDDMALEIDSLTAGTYTLIGKKENLSINDRYKYNKSVLVTAFGDICEFNDANFETQCEVTFENDSFYGVSSNGNEINVFNQNVGCSFGEDFGACYYNN